LAKLTYSQHMDLCVVRVLS